MFWLLNSEHLAHRLGPNRCFVPGAIALVASVLSYAVGTYVDHLVFHDMLNVPTALIWIEPLLWVVVAVALGQAAWWASIDRAGGAYVSDARRFKISQLHSDE